MKLDCVFFCIPDLYGFATLSQNLEMSHKALKHILKKIQKFHRLEVANWLSYDSNPRILVKYF
jgi:hypothetical protein